MRRRLLVFFLAAALLGCGCAASAAGGADDPLVSLDYAQSWAEGLVEEAAEAARAAFDEAFGDAEAVPASGSRQVRLSAGQAVRLREGASVTLTSGSARVALNAGALVNATVGGEAVTGKLNARQLYIACENCDATITASAASTLDISGEHETVHTQLSFTDVPQNAWFYSYVYDAVELGLVDGMDAKTFAPDGSFTVAQAVKIAACMHQLYHEGAVTLQNGDPWYTSYVDYAVQNGVAPQDYASLSESELNAAISRRDYVALFYNALPAAEYAAINSVPDGSIPDVDAADPSAAQIYAFYRAGILNGSDGEGSFLPDSGIKRSEVAAIVVRMFDKSERISVTLN